MGRGKSLSQVEIGQILAYHDENRSGSWIANKIKRSKSVVNDFLRDPEQYGQAKRSGRPRSMTDRDRRHVLRLITDENKSCSSVISELGLKCHRSTVYRAAREAEHVQFKKANHKPPLSKEHRASRLEFAKNFIDFGDKWISVMFQTRKNSILMVRMVFIIFGQTFEKRRKFFPSGNSEVVALWCGRG